MASSPVSDLAAVLAETADLLDTSPESPQAGAAPSTLAEILRRERLALLDAGALQNPRGLKTLFLPTGAIQDMSLGGGWGAAYLGLAERFDAALTAYRPPPQPKLRGAASGPRSRTVRRRHVGRWLAAAVVAGLVVWAGSAGGGPALVGVALIALGGAVAVAGALFWVFQDGLFTRLPTLGQTLRDPRRLALALLPLAVSVGLVVAGARLVLRSLGL